MNNSKSCSNTYKVGVRRGTSLLINSWTLVVFTFSVLVISCSNGNEMSYREESAKVADSVSAYVSNIATDTIDGITHNFIRNADVKLKVKDVLQSTKQIESLVNNVGGYITKSELNSNKDYSNRINFKKDSLIEQTYYTASSHIVLRVPNKQLDSVINSITDMAVFVDFRNIKSDDVKLKLFANILAENRYKQYKGRIQAQIEKKPAKLQHITEAEENVLEKQTLADNKRVETYDLADQVNYSTVTLALYQEQNIISNVLPIANKIQTYEPSFLSKMAQAFVNGFEILKNILLFFANAWSLIIVLVLSFLGVKKLILYLNKKTAAPQV